MIGFLVIAGLLLSAAMLFVVPPLLGRRSASGRVSQDAANVSIYRDQIKELEGDLANGSIERLQYDATRREIERRALEDVEQQADMRAAISGPRWSLAAGIAVAIPLVAIPLYVVIGAPAALDPQRRAAAKVEGEGHELSPQRIAAMIDQLKEKLKEKPNDAEGWIMLARTSGALARYQESVDAYREAARLTPNDAQLLADFADALAMAQGRVLTGEPERLIAQALKVDPRNVKALALAGTIAFQKEAYAEAAALWKRILEVVPAESEFAQRISASVSEAEAKALGVGAAGAVATAPVPSSPAAAGTPAPAGAARLSGKVEVSERAKKSAAPGDTVFVFARAVSGPKMPLAVLRFEAKDLPRVFELTDAMAMTPGMSIGKFSPLLVAARLSRSGNPLPQPGDWESNPVEVRAGAEGIKLLIDRQIK